MNKNSSYQQKYSEKFISQPKFEAKLKVADRQ